MGKVDATSMLASGGIDVILSHDFSATSKQQIEPDALLIGEALDVWGKNAVEFVLPKIERSTASTAYKVTARSADCDIKCFVHCCI